MLKLFRFHVKNNNESETINKRKSLLTIIQHLHYTVDKNDGQLNRGYANKLLFSNSHRTDVTCKYHQVIKLLNKMHTQFS